MELYKYVVPARIDVLQHQLIRFTQPSEFNDPWEALPKFDAFFQQELVDTFKDEVIDEHRRGRYEELLEKEIAKSRERYGVDLSSKQREIIRQAFKKEFIPNAEKEISNMADTVLGLKTFPLFEGI